MQPPASLKALGDPIYEAFYGLTEQPFAITTDPRFFYLSASHQRIFTELFNGLRRRESLLMLTGETGSGKTTLCRAVLSALGERTFSAIILNPYMTGAEVLRIVLRDFGLVSHEELRRGGLATADIPQLLDTLEGFLKSLVPLGSHAVIVLDEAQALTPVVLDQIRMLTGLEYQGKRLVQVVLCGQPNLLKTIKSESLMALNERITRRVELTALPAEDVRGYIEHRLGVAGGTDAVRFDDAAIRAVADLSRGLPRRINVLCDRALQEGRIEGVNVITADLVKRAARAIAGVHDPLPVLPAEPVKPAPPVPASTPAPFVTPAAAVAPPVVTSVVTPPTPEPPPEPPAVVPWYVSTPVSGIKKLEDEEKIAEQVPEPVALAESAAPLEPVLAESATVPAPEPDAIPTSSPIETLSSESVPVETQAWLDSEVSTPSPEPLPETPAATPTIPEAAEAATVEPELTFGMEKPREGRGLRWVTMTAAAVVIVGSVGYSAWAWDVIGGTHTMPAVPPGPTLNRGEVVAELPVPTSEEIRALFPVPRFAPLPPPDPAVETPPDAASPQPSTPAPQAPDPAAPAN